MISSIATYPGVLLAVEEEPTACGVEVELQTLPNNFPKALYAYLARRMDYKCDHSDVFMGIDVHGEVCFYTTVIKYDGAKVIFCFYPDPHPVFYQLVSEDELLEKYGIVNSQNLFRPMIRKNSEYYSWKVPPNENHD